MENNNKYIWSLKIQFQLSSLRLFHDTNKKKRILPIANNVNLGEVWHNTNNTGRWSDKFVKHDTPDKTACKTCHRDLVPTISFQIQKRVRWPSAWNVNLLQRSPHVPSPRSVLCALRSHPTHTPPHPPGLAPGRMERHVMLICCNRCTFLCSPEHCLFTVTGTAPWGVIVGFQVEEPELPLPSRRENKAGLTS